LSQYYFTVASLPLLNFEIVCPLRYDEFLEICGQNLSDHDFAAVESARLDVSDLKKAGNGILNRWILFERSLKNELVKLRGSELGIEPEKYIKHFVYNTSTPIIARNALKQEDPLKAEYFLDRARWNFLDEMEIGHYFDVEKLIVYSLQLQILERKMLFNLDQGKENFQNIYGKIKTAIRTA